MRLKVHSMLKIIKPTIISVCFFSSLAYATESESTPKDEIKYSSPTILQVEQIQAETVIYEAKLARQKAVSELRNLDLNGVASATPAITPSSGYSSLADTDIPAQRAAAKSLRVIEMYLDNGKSELHYQYVQYREKHPKSEHWRTCVLFVDIP